jgi:hypothetical protein
MRPTKCAKCDTMIMAWRHRDGKAVCAPCLTEIRSSNGRCRMAGQTPPIGAVKERSFRGRMYWMIYAPDHPHTSVSGWIMQHRVIMEAKLGRLLTTKEVVHHIDHNGLNNDPDNLMLCESKGKHLAEHHAQDAGFASRDTRPLCTACGSRTDHGRTLCWPCYSANGDCGRCGRSNRKLAKVGLCHGCYKTERMARKRQNSEP